MRQQRYSKIFKDIKICGSKDIQICGSKDIQRFSKIFKYVEANQCETDASRLLITSGGHYCHCRLQVQLQVQTQIQIQILSRGASQKIGKHM